MSEAASRQQKVVSYRYTFSFQDGATQEFLVELAYDSLVRSNASVKHIVIISDGDPQTPNWALVKKVQKAKITISTICINPHSPRDAKTMQDLARLGGGNFYYPKNYKKLPQIFIKEAATVRKSLIFEEPFSPKTAQYSPVLVGFQNSGYPTLLGYVGTSAKDSADIPLVTDLQPQAAARVRDGDLLIVAPLALEGMDGAPCRVFAVNFG